MLSSGPQPAGRRWLVFLLGLALGAGGGFWAGRNISSGGRPAEKTQTTTIAPPAPIPETLEPTPPPAAIPPPDDGIRRIAASVSGSLSRTLSEQLEQREADVLGAHLGRLLIWWLDLRRDVLSGDRLEVLYRPHADPEKVRVLALRYHSQKLGQELEAFFFHPQGERYGRYYDAEGKEIELRLQAAPVDDYEQVTERMNLAGRRHRGVDFKTDVGTPVVAPRRARVFRRNWHTRANGNCLQLVYLENGRYALFLHLDSVEPETKPGVVVQAGQVVAHTGNTGRSTAPHLHYELHSADGRLLDPFLEEPTVRRQIKEDQLVEFKKTRDEALRRISGPASNDATTPPPDASTPETGTTG